MTVGDRIGERIKQTGISQSELARRVNLRQSTISGLIKGEQRSTTHLHEIARELGTTPAYLSGETDDPNEDAPALPELTYEERQLVECYAALSAIQRQALLTIALTMAGKLPSGQVHTPLAHYRSEPANAGQV